LFIFFHGGFSQSKWKLIVEYFLRWLYPVKIEIDSWNFFIVVLAYQIEIISFTVALAPLKSKLLFPQRLSPVKKSQQ
jgi:hypothetical protein